jgi:hypothetical protein
MPSQFTSHVIFRVWKMDVMGAYVADIHYQKNQGKLEGLEALVASGGGGG